MEKGLVHLYYGTGAGKTTAAVGLCARAAGAGLMACFVSFLKGRPTAELASLQKLGVQVLRPRLSVRFWFVLSECERQADAAAMQSALSQAALAAQSCDLVVLDEVLDAEDLGALLPGSIERFLQTRPVGCEVVLTGHAAPQTLLSMADYVTRFDAQKHPYDKGVLARKGIEY